MVITAGSYVFEVDKPDEEDWAIVCLSLPTTGHVHHHILRWQSFPLDPVDTHSLIGRSLESEFAWIQGFGKDFGAASSVQSLKRMFEEVSSLIESSKFDQIDRILGMGEPRDYTMDFSTGLLRATCQYRNVLPNWQRWFLKTKECLIATGQDAESELAGLDS
ncbi:hypothetical protein [Pelagibius marinus]|uniref:hypothetical protein n=1 Tax=Pelagibius marinus TaxID=2762760 RepID=UPI001872CE8B|nr:hypothetical protein [Pelagibius marinus]